MRDILVTVLIFGSLPFILWRPHIGVMVWAWISYMNPHRLTWGFAYTLPFAQIVAVCLFISLLISKEKKSFPVDGLMVAWFALLIWMTISTVFAINSEAALYSYERAMKIQLLTFITIMCMRDHQRVNLLVWTIAVSIGFYSIKGGIFTLVTAGSFRVYGPGNSFIAENNALALATLMTVPLMAYLRSISTRKWLRLGLLGAIVLSLISSVGSQSRGALVTILALGAYFWWQSKSKMISAIAVLIIGAFVFTFMPQSWHERMGTIQSYQEDGSAMSRIDAWTLSINLANARLTGGGFSPFSQDTYARYYKPVDKAFVAHSIYFDVLSAHGWPGLFLFLTIFGLTWRNLDKVIKSTKHVPDKYSQWMLARMLKLSLIAYLSGGAFLSLAYFDLPWHIVAIAYLLKHQLHSPEHAENAAHTRGDKPPPTRLKPGFHAGSNVLDPPSAHSPRRPHGG